MGVPRLTTYIRNDSKSKTWHKSINLLSYKNVIIDMFPFLIPVYSQFFHNLSSKLIFLMLLDN